MRFKQFKFRSAAQHANVSTPCISRARLCVPLVAAHLVHTPHEGTTPVQGGPADLEGHPPAQQRLQQRRHRVVRRHDTQPGVRDPQ